MNEHFDFESLAAAAERSPMLQAAEVRRLGARRRLGRQLRVGAGMLALGVVASVGLWFSPLGSSTTVVPASPTSAGEVSPTPDVFPTPDASPTAHDTPSPEPASPSPEPTETKQPTEPSSGKPGRKLSFALLPEAAELHPSDEGLVVTKEAEGRPDAKIFPCLQEDLGEKQAIYRTYGAPGYPSYMTALALDFGSTDSASAAAESIKAGLKKDCVEKLTAAGVKKVEFLDTTDIIKLDTDGVQANLVRVGSYSVGGFLDDDNGGRSIMVDLVQADNQVFALIRNHVGWDDDCVIEPDEFRPYCPEYLAAASVLKKLS